MTNLSTNTRQTINGIFHAILAPLGFLGWAIDVEVGDWLADLYSSVTGGAVNVGNILFSKEVNHTIGVEASTTTDAAGANLTIGAGLHNGSGADGVLVLGGSTTSAVSMGSTGKKIGFFGVVPIVRPAAIIQTYSTTTATLADNTSATLTDSSGGTPGTTVAAITEAGTAGSADITPTKNAIASLVTQTNALEVDLLNTKGVLNTLIDQLQALGLTQ